MLLQSQKKGKEGLKQRLLHLERLALIREEAMEHYAKQAEERKKKFIKEGSLILRYNNRFDYNKKDKFVPHWEGPFKVMEKFDNGSYQLMDASGVLHKQGLMDGNLSHTSHRFWRIKRIWHR